MWWGRGEGLTGGDSTSATSEMSTWWEWPAVVNIIVEQLYCTSSTSLWLDIFSQEGSKSSNLEVVGVFLASLDELAQFYFKHFKHTCKQVW